MLDYIAEEIEPDRQSDAMRKPPYECSVSQEVRAETVNAIMAALSEQEQKAIYAEAERLIYKIQSRKHNLKGFGQLSALELVLTLATQYAM